MKCPYPDCPGDIQPNEQFCGECGRSLAPAAVQAALTGMQARTAQPVAPAPRGDVYRAPISPTTPQPQLAPRPATLPMGLILGAAVGLLFLFGLFAIGAALLNTSGSPTPTPGPATGKVNDSWQFQLADLTIANDWTVIHQVLTVDKAPLGDVSVRRGGSYETQGAGEKMVSIIIAEGRTDIVELVATRDSTYENIAPGWAVVESSKTLTRELPSGLTLEINPQAIDVDRRPLLPTNHRTGTQPIFSSLALALKVSGEVKE